MAGLSAERRIQRSTACPADRVLPSLAGGLLLPGGPERRLAYERQLLALSSPLTCLKTLGFEWLCYVGLADFADLGKQPSNLSLVKRGRLQSPSELEATFEEPTAATQNARLVGATGPA